MSANAKGWLQSKTILLNGAIALPIVLEQIAGLISESGDLIPTEVSKWILFGLALANIVLRGITSQPVAAAPLKKPEQ